MRIKSILSFCFGTLLIMSCATESAYVFTDLPPRAKLEGNETIAVDFFKGNNAAEVSSEIESLLLDKGYKVVDRKKLVSLFREKIIDPQHYQLVPANYLISGSVNNYKYWTRSRSEPMGCFTPLQGEWTGSRHILQSIGDLNVTIRITNTKSGELVFTDKIATQQILQNEGSSCSSNEAFHPSRSETMSKTLLGFRKEFEKVISKYKDMIHIQLFTYDKDLLPELAEGHKWMRRSNFVKASSAYSEALKKVKNKSLPREAKAHTLFAYGLSLAFMNNSKGLNIIDEAYEINPEDTYLYERNKVKNRLKLVEPRVPKAQ